MATLLDLPPDSASVARLVRRLYVHHAKNYADGFALGAMSREEIVRQTVVFGMDRLSRVLEGGRGAVIATAHLGNVDLGGNGLVARGARCGVLVEQVEPAWLLEFFVRNRTKFSPDVIPYREGVLPHLLATVKRNVALGITCDWDMQGNGVPVTCAGKTMMMPAGLALIALRARAPIIPIFSTRMRDNRTAVYVEPPLDVPLSGKLKEDVPNVSQALAAVLERYLLRYPDQWVLFHPAWPSPTGNRAARGAGAPRRPS